MDESNWKTLALSLCITMAGFYFALSTKTDTDEDEEIKRSLLRYVKLTGWIFAIGGIIACIHLILIMLGYMSQ